MSKRKGTLSPGPEGFFRTWSNCTSFCFSFPEVGTGAGMGTCTDVACCCVSSVIFSLCFKYDFPDRIPVGWGTSICVVQACLSPSESLREAVITLPSSDKTENVTGFALWLRFLQIPLFVLGEVWVYPHDFPHFQCQGNETLNLLIFSRMIIYLQLCFRDWKRPIRNCDFLCLAELKTHHVCSDFLLFWL